MGKYHKALNGSSFLLGYVYKYSTTFRVTARYICPKTTNRWLIRGQYVVNVLIIPFRQRVTGVSQAFTYRIAVFAHSRTANALDTGLLVADVQRFRRKDLGASQATRLGQRHSSVT